MLSQPQDQLELQQKNRIVAVTSMSFALGEVGTIRSLGVINSPCLFIICGSFTHMWLASQFTLS